MARTFKDKPPKYGGRPGYLKTPCWAWRSGYFTTMGQFRSGWNDVVSPEGREQAKKWANRARRRWDHDVIREADVFEVPEEFDPDVLHDPLYVAMELKPYDDYPSLHDYATIHKRSPLLYEGEEPSCYDDYEYRGLHYYCTPGSPCMFDCPYGRDESDDYHRLCTAWNPCGQFCPHYDDWSDSDRWDFDNHY